MDVRATLFRSASVNPAVAVITLVVPNRHYNISGISKWDYRNHQELVSGSSRVTVKRTMTREAHGIINKANDDEAT